MRRSSSHRGPAATGAARSRAWRWFLLAAACWSAAGWLDLETPCRVSVWNGRLQWTVGDTVLEAEVGPVDISGISLELPGSFHPIDVGDIVTTDASGTVSRLNGPFRRTDPPSSPPTGDWWVDSRIDPQRVESFNTPLSSECTIEMTVRGRAHQWVTLVLDGSPSYAVGFRRGLINNDLAVFDADGSILTAASLDPIPLGRLASVAAQILHACAGGALLLGIWAVIGRGRTPETVHQAPSASRAPFVAALVCIGLIGSALACWVAVDIFDGLPHLPDEIVYRLQSRWMADGHLTGPEPLCPQYLPIPLTYFRGGRWIGHYPPAWPLFLAPASILHAPWLTATVFRFFHLIVIGLLGLRLGGRWTGLGAASIGLVSPLALLLFGSAMPHAGSATLILAALYGSLARTTETSKWRWIAVGAALGTAFGMRPLTAVAAAAPLGLFLLDEIRLGRRRWTDLGWLVLSGAAATVPTAAANAILTGSPWTFPYGLAKGSMMAVEHLAFGIRNLDTLLASLTPVVHGWGWPWLGGPSALALPAAFVAALFLSRKASREDTLLASVAAAIILAHLGARAAGLHGFGPRYYFVPAAVAWILTARGAWALSSLAPGRRLVAPVILGLLTATAAGTAPARLDLFRGYNDVTGNLHRAARALPPCSLVLFPADNWRGWAEASPWLGLPERDDVPVFAADFGETLGLEWCYPDRTFFRWTGFETHPAFTEAVVPPPPATEPDTPVPAAAP